MNNANKKAKGVGVGRISFYQDQTNQALTITAKHFSPKTIRSKISPFIIDLNEKL
jgi:hypothetical protein